MLKPVKVALLGATALFAVSCTQLKNNDRAQSVTIIGAQFGDESKGKVTDLLADQADVVARYNGGDNAGHTIVIDGEKFKLSLIPSGIFRKNVLCVLGAGTVINPENFIKEVTRLKEKGIEISPKNLIIAANTSLILPVHTNLEAILEKKQNLNTTKKGIGPAYEDKVGRRAIRAGDLVNLDVPENRAALEEKVRILLDYHNAFLRGHKAKQKTAKEIMDYLLNVAPQIAPYVADVSTILDRMQKEGKKFLIEGAQSVWLDITHGTYPYVTSSNTLATTGGYGLGISLENNNNLGVIKAYTTRVGNGPFPTLLTDNVGDQIAKIGQEFGSVTGRKRDCGWLDLVTLKQAIAMSGIKSLVLAKGDVLDGLGPIKVCVGYEIDGKRRDSMPFEISEWKNIVPIYKEFKGWNNTKGVKEYSKLDPNYVEYVEFIEKETGIPVVIVSTGPDREETIIRKNPYDVAG
jgi:adenylosuccinate synthase